MAVSISLADDIDISRGDMIARPNNQPHVTQDFDATVCWMADDAALEPGRDYVIKHTTRTTRARVTALDYRLDVNTLHRDKSATALKLNELGRVTLRTQVPLLLDEYARNAATGSFILIDPDTNGTVAAGMVRDTTPAATRTASPERGAPPESGHRARTGCRGAARSGSPGCPVRASRRWRCSSSRSCSKVAVPHTFSTVTTCATGSTPTSASRWPTAPRTCARLAHIATLLADSGQIVLVPAISPLEEHRALARKVHDRPGLRLLRGVLRHPARGLRSVEIPKGLYAKARAR